MVPYLRMETLKTLSYQVAQTYLVHVWECTPWVSKFKGENNVNMRVSFQIWTQLITITFHYKCSDRSMFCSTHIHDRDFKDVFFSNNHQ